MEDNKLVHVSNGVTFSVPKETSNRDIQRFLFFTAFPGCYHLTFELGGKA